MSACGHGDLIKKYICRVMNQDASSWIEYLDNKVALNNIDACLALFRPPPGIDWHDT
jgi:hypothetical protein